MKESITKRNFYQIVRKYEDVLVDLLGGMSAGNISALYCRYEGHCERHGFPGRYGPGQKEYPACNCLFYPEWCSRCAMSGEYPSAKYAVDDHCENRPHKIAHCLRFLNRLADIEQEKGWSAP